ncbi:MAG: thiosulfohydrolase SoxB [Pseudomonadota bacterium]|nr:thiosulfohydrolase SoxB [Pseudomonadota bacterium]
MTVGRRQLLSGIAASAAAGLLPRIGHAQPTEALYDVGRFGNVRVLHQTDTHAQARSIFFREPNANIGIGESEGRPPHLVGQAFLDHFKILAGSMRAHAYSYLEFTEAAHRYGKLGGFAHLKTLIDQLRGQAGAANTILLDGGDLWQGSAYANATLGTDMIALSEMLGVDAMTGHFEFTYGEEQLRKNIAAFSGKFIAQNVFLTEEAAFNGAPSFDADTGRAFQPYVMREIGGRRLAVIGQAFPYVPVAHPARFVPNWTFGIHDVELQKVVDEVRGKEKADAVVLLSHNGMDVDLKLASRVHGIDVILGGHTHDAVPTPSIVANSAGSTVVTNGGSNGKFIGLLDLDIGQGRLNGYHYTLVPVFANLLKPDPAVAAKIESLHAPYAARFGEKLATAGELLYRRGNFTGSMDQVICDALRQQLDAQIVLSPGFRWGPTVLEGDTITMADLQGHTAITYPDAYVQDMTGAQLKSVLEDVCDNLFNSDPYRQQGGDMVRVGGMDYACSPKQTIGSRISNMTLNDGTAVDAAKTYRVAGWASVSLPQDGKPVWDVVAAHLRAAGTVRIARPNKVLVKGIGHNPGYDPP